MLHNPIRGKVQNVDGPFFGFVNHPRLVRRRGKGLIKQTLPNGAQVRARVAFKRAHRGHVPLAAPGKMIRRNEIAGRGYEGVQISVSSHGLRLPALSPKLLTRAILRCVFCRRCWATRPTRSSRSSFPRIRARPRAATFAFVIVPELFALRQREPQSVELFQLPPARAARAFGKT